MQCTSCDKQIQKLVRFCSLCEVTFNPGSYIQSKYFWGTSQGFGI